MLFKIKHKQLYYLPKLLTINNINNVFLVVVFFQYLRNFESTEVIFILNQFNKPSNTPT